MRGEGARRAGEGCAPDSNVLPNSSAAPSLDELAKQQGLPAERLLLERIGEALAVLNGLKSSDRKPVCEVLDTITSGQELDLQRFGGASTERIVALNTDAELDDYTYRVAGCVGEFWTRMCRTHVFPHARLDDARLLADGVRFGKGLQLVNILRDLPRDLRQGRCYLPADRLAKAGLSPRDLLDDANEPRLRPLYDELLALAHAHLTAGWAYTCALPWQVNSTTSSRVNVRGRCITAINTSSTTRPSRVTCP
jgi:farnesyl-diphosphate farnesyltransferase